MYNKKKCNPNYRQNTSGPSFFWGSSDWPTATAMGASGPNYYPTQQSFCTTGGHGHHSPSCTGPVASIMKNIAGHINNLNPCFNKDPNFLGK